MRDQSSSCPNYLKRFFSGLILIPVVIGIILAGPPWTTGLMILIALGLSQEWIKLARLAKTKKSLFFYGIILGSIGLYVIWGIRMSGAFLLGSSALFYYVISRVKKYQGEGVALWFFFGMLYVGIPSLSFLWIMDAADKGGIILIWALCVIWAADIGAYYVGSWIGGPKMAPRISPKKTWSGFAGGLCASILVGVWGGIWFLRSEHFFILVGVTFGIAILSVLGDLMESSLKRFWGAKDSGSIIPGHGGLLDRLDSTLAVLPFLAGIVEFLGRNLFNVVIQ